MQLKELLRQNGLTVSGKKAELIQRLKFNTEARDAVTASAKKRVRAGATIDISESPTKKIRLASPAPPRKRSPLSQRSPSSTSMASLSSRKPSSRSLTSSTKASMLRRKIPTESDTAHLVTRRSMRRSPRAESTAVARIPAAAVAKSRSSTDSVSSTSSETTTIARINAAAETKTRSSTDSASSIISERSTRSTRSTRSATGRRPTSSKSTTSRRSDETKDNSMASSTKARRPARVTTAKTVKTESPLGRRKERSEPLSSLTNSARKRKTNRRQDMAKSVNAALMELEKLHDSL